MGTCCMSVDLEARKILAERQQAQSLAKKFDDLGKKIESLPKPQVISIGDKNSGASEKLTAASVDYLGKTVTKLIERVILDESLKDSQEEIKKALTDLKSALEIIYVRPAINIPDKVTVSNLYEVVNGLKNLEKVLVTISRKENVEEMLVEGQVKVTNLSELSTSFSNLERELASLRTILGQREPQSDNQDYAMFSRTLTKGLSSLEKNLSSFASKVSEQKMITVEQPPIDIEKLEGWMQKLYEFETNKPTFVPPAVTNVNINALNGAIKTTSATVGTTPIGLPTYGVLANRRSIVIYNNDSSTTLYYGGSEVTASSGMPVPPNSYSPILDLGVNVVPYAVTNGGSINIRVMEVSNTAKGM